MTLLRFFEDSRTSLNIARPLVQHATQRLESTQYFVVPEQKWCMSSRASSTFCLLLQNAMEA